MSEATFPEEFLRNGRKTHINMVRLATSIGLLVIQFNRFEHDIGEFLAVFLSSPNQGEISEDIAIMTAALSFGQKLDLLSALYLKRYKNRPEQCEVFRKLISELSTFEEFRNTQVHSRWGTGSFSDTEFKRIKPTIKGRKGLRQATEFADSRKIRATCNTMWEFHWIEMLSIYRGCVRYEEMSEETITRLNGRFISRGKSLSGLAA